MTLGRTRRGGAAATILNLDSELSADLIEQVKKIKHINDAKVVKL
jgi:hypothetical protein